jgi:glycine cleavage system H protein
MSEKYKIPINLLYTDTHEWVSVEGDIATIGITDYAQDLLHEIVFVELPERGSEVKRGESIAEIESVKSVAKVYSPLSGSIIEVNEVLEEKPELINDDPYGEGWIAKIKMNNFENERKLLLSYEEYMELIEAEIE